LKLSTINESKRQIILAVDLDGTLANEDSDFDTEKIGSPIYNAKKIMDEVKELDVCIIINTCRGDKKVISAWLDEHEIAYDHVNENPHQPNDSSDKIMADRYWDNKQPSWRGLQYALEELKRYMNRS